MMLLNDYQQFTKTTAIYPQDRAIEYTTLGLVSEAGEVAGKLKKIIRDNDGKLTDQHKLDIMKEVGDVLWYVARLSDELGYDLSVVAFENQKKLLLRKENNTIKGSGDNR